MNIEYWGMKCKRSSEMFPPHVDFRDMTLVVLKMFVPTKKGKHTISTEVAEKKCLTAQGYHGKKITNAKSTHQHIKNKTACISHYFKKHIPCNFRVKASEQSEQTCEKSQNPTLPNFLPSGNLT